MSKADTIHTSKKRAHNFIDLTGRRFGRLLVTSFHHTAKKLAWWNTVCDCGTTKVVQGSPMRAGRIMSCGCYHDECSAQNRATHGHARRKHKHPEYGVWKGLRKRCLNKNDKSFQRYGGRGISVCERWSDFSKFLEDVGPRPTQRHTLDRYPDKNGNYEPGNVRWATAREQANNTRKNVYLEYKGESKTVAEWARAIGIPPQLINRRRYLGWSVEDALSTKRKVNQYNES